MEMSRYLWVKLTDDMLDGLLQRYHMIIEKYSAQKHGNFASEGEDWKESAGAL